MKYITIAFLLVSITAQGQRPVLSLGNPFQDGSRDPRVVALERRLFPGYGTCERCHRPWNCCIGKNVAYSDTEGCFPICEDCWNDCTVPQRKHYFRELYLVWRADGVPRPKDTVGLYKKLMDAVDRESAKPNEWQQMQALQYRLDSLTHAFQTLHDSFIELEKRPCFYLATPTPRCGHAVDSLSRLMIISDTATWAPKKKRRKG